LGICDRGDQAVAGGDVGSCSIDNNRRLIERRPLSISRRAIFLAAVSRGYLLAGNSARDRPRRTRASGAWR
jgi:hypothetical protein